jgi:hypothetical protein
MDVSKTKASFTNAEGTFVPDNLHAGDFPIRTRKVTIALGAGQNLVRGAVLGKITASGKYILSLSAAADGSQIPAAILAEDTNAVAADQEAVAYISGDFNENALTIGAAHTIASIKDTLRDANIYLHKPVSA